MNGQTNLPKVIEILEADPLLLEILGDVLLYDPGSPDIPYSQPLIPRSLIVQRLVDYLSLNFSLDILPDDEINVVNQI